MCHDIYMYMDLNAPSSRAALDLELYIYIYIYIPRSDITIFVTICNAPSYGGALALGLRALLRDVGRRGRRSI